MGVAAQEMGHAIELIRQCVSREPSLDIVRMQLVEWIRQATERLSDTTLAWSERRLLLTRVQLLQRVISVPQVAQIPKIIHFLKPDSKPAHIGPINSLSIKSAIHSCPDYQIVLHTPQIPVGPMWEQLLPDIELNLEVPPQNLGQHRIVLAAHQADVWRAEKLLEHGGFYFDWDLVLMRAPTDLLNHVCVMGVEPLVPDHTEVMGVSAIGAQPQSVFLQCWLNGMASAFRPDHYVAHSTMLAREVALGLPASVRVLPSDSFYFPGWTDEAMAWLFDPACKVSEVEREARLANSWGIHLFESNKTFLSRKEHLSLESLRRSDCNFSALFSALLK
jgi:hypothetical protein